MVRLRQALAVLSLLLLVGCSGIARFGDSPALQFPSQDILTTPGALPQAPRAVSASTTVDGSAHDGCGGSVTDQPPAAVIDAAAAPCSWARYVYGMPEGGELRFIGIEVEEVLGGYWVGLSDYGGTARWEWHGPYTASSMITPNGEPGNYLSATGNLYWVVLATTGNSLRVISSTVSGDWPDPEQVRRVPPPGQHLAAPGPAAHPSLVVMPQIEGVSEEGAPVIFYTAGEGEDANTCLAYYDGDEWVQRPAAPEGTRLTRGIARWTTQGGVIAAYNASTGLGAIGKPGTVNVLRTDSGWCITEAGYVGGPIDYALTQLAMDSDQSGDYVAITRSYDTSFGQKCGFNMLTPMGEHFSSPLELGDMVAAAAAAFDPTGGPTLAMYSMGTTDTDGTVLLDYMVTVQRFDDGWNHDSEWLDRGAPVGLDLGYSSAGDPQLLMVCGHDVALESPPEIDTEATLRFDVSIGTWNGLYWSYLDLLTGTATVDYGMHEIEVDLAADAAWAGPAALSCSTAAGIVEYTADDGFAITAGDLAVTTHFYTDDGEGYGESAYFTGDAGLQHDWEEGPGGPCCAWIGADTIDIEVLLDVYAHQTGDLLYWSPDT